jgi:hypothetical protein
VALTAVPADQRHRARPGATRSARVGPRLLALVERALIEGDSDVENAVCLSFVEHVGVYNGETEDFIASWPAGLLTELRGQRALQG